MDSDKINLIVDEEENDYYIVQIIKDNKNPKYNFLDIKLEFGDNLCIYRLDNEKLIYDISYYNIISWLSGKKQFGINYKMYNGDLKQIIFKVDNSNDLIKSIKNNVNHLLEYEGKSDRKMDL
tara:strand:+ start:487 stop:852 length:366 start_codon:yes stop_codon:yes gene_type:complete